MIKQKLAFVAAALALGTAFATAQEVKPVGLSIRGGLLFPSNGDARNEGKTWFAFGADYKLGDIAFGDMKPGVSSHYTISVDYYGKGDFRNVPIMLNYVGRQDQFYYLAGAGIGFTNVRLSPAQTERGNEFCYTIGVGWDWQKGTTPIFFEARWWGSAEAKVNGFALYAGFRF